MPESNAVECSSDGEAVRRNGDGVWDEYYGDRQIPAFMKQCLLDHALEVIADYVPRGRNLIFCELGGGNSVLYPELIRRYDVAEYHVIDNNEVGLEQFRRQAGGRQGIAHNLEILGMEKYPCSADVTLSAGLVEHFDPAGTRRCLEQHGALTKPGGTMVISFPFGTPLYWGVRGLATLAGRWPRVYERPLGAREVLSALRPYGNVIHVRTLWRMILTQKLMVFRRRKEGVEMT